MRNLCLLALALVLLGTDRAGALELTNPRAMYNLLGVPKSNTKFLPGDIFLIVFDINDLEVDQDGVAKYRQGMKIFDGKKEIFNEAPSNVKVVPLFGATKMPGFVSITVGQEQLPGSYKAEITIEDVQPKKAKVKTLTFAFDVKKKAFGIVAPGSPAIGFLGHDFVAAFSVTGMARDKTTKLPDVDVELTVRDAKGNKLNAAPIKNSIKEMHQEGVFDLTRLSVVPLNFPMLLSKSGKITVEVLATDKITKEEAKLRLHVWVLNPQTYIDKAMAAP
jgi:hypothetical protein